MTTIYKPTFPALLFSSKLPRSARAIVVAGTFLSPLAYGEDLLQAFALARQHDANIAAAVAQSQAAAKRVAQVRGALLPNVNLTVSATRDRFNLSDAQSDLAGAGTETRINSTSLNLRQPLLNLAATTDVDLAVVSANSSRQDYEIAFQDFMLQVAQAYFDVLAAQEVLETRRLSKQAIQGQLDAAIRKFKAGLGIITDEDEAQARYNLAEADEIASENDLRIARLTLERLTGKTGITPKAMATDRALSQISAGNLNDWLRDTSHHPAVLRAQLAFEKAKLDTRRAKVAMLPTVDLLGSTGKNRVGGTANPINQLPTGRSTNSSVGIQLNMPLFSGFSQYNRVSETVLLEEQARQLLDGTTRSAEEGTARAYFDLHSALAKAKALTAAEASSRNSLEGTQRSYKAGLRLNLDVLNAQSQLYQTRSDLAKVRYDVLIRSLKLKAAAGKLDQESLAEINRLL